MKTAIWWIKRDIRLHDNGALNDALQQAETVLPLFVFETGLVSQTDCSAMHVFAWHSALQDLRFKLRAIGSNVSVHCGDTISVLSTLHKKLTIDAIFSHQETGNDWTYKRDIAVSRWCQRHGIRWVEQQQTAVIRRLTNRDKRRPLFKARLIESAVVPTPARVPLPAPMQSECEQQTMPEYTDFFQPDQYQHVAFDQLQPVSETHAQRALQSFLHRRGIGYSGGISSSNSAFSSGSRLSPHLAWGTLSLRNVFQATAEAQLMHRVSSSDEAKQWGKSLRAFSSRLHWHDHFIQRLESAPETEFSAIDPAYRDVVYEDDPAKLHAWTYGQTGFPMIDACMRCLQACGFLNFRMRAMVVSFAVYGLHLSWRTIHPPLAQIFLDYEPGIHLSQLQMQAGVAGINNTRVTNPTKQIIDQDPNCVFIKRWIPELAECNSEDIIHYEQSSLGSYPRPIVDFKSASSQMKSQIFRIRKSEAGRQASKEVPIKHGSRKKTAAKPPGRHMQIF